MTVQVLIVAFNIVFFIHNVAYLALIQKVFDIKSKKRKMAFFSFLSGTTGTALLVVFGSMSALGYGIMLVVFLVMVMLFYKGQATMARLACVLSLNVHIMAMRAIVTSIMAMVKNESIYELSKDPVTFWLGLMFTAALGTLVSLLIVFFVPQKYLAGISGNTLNLFLYTITAVIANVYMIANGNVYIHDIHYQYLPVHQLIVAFTWLSVTYVNVVMLAVYKRMRERKESFEKDSFYKQVVAKRSMVVMEVNCTKDKVISLLYYGEQELKNEVSYTQYIEGLLKELVLIDDFEFVRREDSLAMMIASFQSGETEITFNGRIMLNGEMRWVRTLISLREDRKTHDIMAVITISDDIHETMAKENALRAQAENDTLVGVYNKKAFERHVKENLAYGGGVLFMIDLDNFKAINDTFGHAYGDEVLKEVCKKIENNFRSDDLVGRVGGDEFMVFVKNNPSREDIAKKATALCKHVNKTYSSQGQDVAISCSIGIAVAEGVSKNFETLYNEADAAMYVCKKGNKNGYHIHE